MLCLSVLVAAGVTGLCLGTSLPETPQPQEPLCPRQHSCFSRGTSGNPLNPGCSCDATCRIYGDCCRGSQYYDQAEQTRNMDKYDCVEYTRHDGRKDHVYMRGKCSEEWAGAEVEAACLKGNTFPQPIKSLPVTSYATNRTYVNVYCAFCNNEDLDSLRMWDVNVVCEGVTVPTMLTHHDNDAVYYEGSGTVYNEGSGARFDVYPDNDYDDALNEHSHIYNDDEDSLPIANYNYDLVYNEGTWGVTVSGSDLSSVTQCQADFTVPNNLVTVTCLPSVKTCTGSGPQEHERALCQSYTAAVYHDEFIFRNKHCASCNGYTQYTCVPPPPPTPPPSYILTISFDFYLKIEYSLCSSEEVWDSQSWKCRKVFCSNSGEKFYYGRCISVIKKDDAALTTTNHEPLCPLRHSCLAPNLRDRGCSCDATCRIYGDCCRDSQYYDQAEQMKNANEYECVGFNPGCNSVNQDYVYMRGKCSEQWTNATVQELCLAVNTLPDAIESLPVTSTTTGLTYVNHYCALCNGADPATLRTWIAKVECIRSNLPQTGWNEDYAIVNHERTWGVIVPSLGLESFTQCSFEFKLPEDVRNLTTQCLPTVNTCPDSGAEKHEQILCQSYSAVVSIETFNDNLRVRNEHCAACNGYKQYEQYSCVPQPIPPETCYPATTLQMLLDVRDRSGSNCVGFTSQCGSEEVWDEGSGKCRKMVCPTPGETFSCGRCVRVEDDAEPSTKDEGPLCPIHHSCSFPNVRDRGCSCDSICKTHGDCCRDSQYYDQAEQIKNMNEYMCVEYVDAWGEPGNVYMRGKCLDGWQNKKEQELCLKGNTLPDHTKLFPVTNTNTGRTYVNQYCALCNDEDPASLRTWNAWLECPEVSRVSDENYGVVFHEGRWGVILPGLGLPSFLPCSLQFQIPTGLYISLMNNRPTQCLPTIKTCNGSRSEEQEQTLCQSYTAAVYHGDVIFRNQHCASCNGFMQYTCGNPTVRSNEAFTRVYPFTMSLVFTDYSDGTSSQECGAEEVWDRESYKCRKIFCSRPGERFSYGGCVGA